MSSPRSVTGEAVTGGSGDTDPLIGRAIADKFVVEHLLGAGAMGAVYRAHQVALDRPVAIKVMHPELARNALFAARFQREAMAASRIDHPNLTRVIDYGQEADGLLYLAMEYLGGSDLFQYVEQHWPLSAESIIDILSQVLAGLATAHDAGIVHRDLKPENIMLLQRKADDGKPVMLKVCDFGIAKILEEEEDGTSAASGSGAVKRKEPPAKPVRKVSTAGLVVGTPEFMSPEQARGEPLDARSDLFSIGIILYRLLAGVLPFEGSSAINTVLKVIEVVPPPPSSFAPSDSALEAICVKAMQKRPDQRYRDAREMRAALLGIRLGTARTEPPPLITSATSATSAASAVSERQRTLTAPVVAVRAPRRSAYWAVGVLLAAAAGIGFLRRPAASPAAAAPPPSTTAVAPVPAPVPPPTNAPVQASPVNVPDPPPAPSETVALPSPHRAPPSPRPRPILREAPGAAAPPDVPAANLPAPPSTSAPSLPTQEPAPVPAPPPPLAARPPSFDPATAHVVLGLDRATGFSTLALKRVFGTSVASRATRCYADALGAGAPHDAVSAFLEFQTDDDGVIVDARVGPSVPASVGECVTGAVDALKLPGADTGHAAVRIPVEFVPR